jgi:hypothetical protein
LKYGLAGKVELHFGFPIALLSRPHGAIVGHDL